MYLVNCEIHSTTYKFFLIYIITSYLCGKISELVLDLDAVEVDAMEDSDEVQDIQTKEFPQRNEDLFDYDNIALDIGGSSPREAAPEPQWDPLNFD